MDISGRSVVRIVWRSVALLLVGGADATVAQSPDGGSAVPCAAPLAWRIARVDPEFGLSSADAARVVGEAAALWEGAVGGRLFVRDPADGFPVRLVYDERQREAVERRRHEEALDEVAAELATERLRLQRREGGWTRERAAYEERVRSYETRRNALNATIRAWNEQGGAPEEVARDLRIRSSALDDDEAALRAAGRALEESLATLQRDQRGLRGRVEEHRSALDELSISFPSLAVRSGVYREAVVHRDGRLESVSREIRIYRFLDEEELRLVAAHELGHALGLGHSSVTGAIMSEEHVRAPGSGAPSQLHVHDRASLRASCPGLAGGRP